MISSKALKQFLGIIPSMNILVVGDLILDHYQFGQVNRISPEAPVPVLLSEREEYRLGGAGNVFLNIKSLGASASLSGVVGNDEAGGIMRQIAAKEFNAVTEDRRITPVKTRLMANRHHIMRIDREVTRPISNETASRILSGIEKSRADAFLLSDYAKGTLSNHLSQQIIKLAKSRHIPVIADPKPANIDFFRNASAVTPNHSEAEAILGIRIDSDEKAAWASSALLRRLQTQTAVITRGDHGVTARQRKHKAIHMPALSHEVFDVTGAGDTFAALLVLGMVASLPLRQTLFLANAAASIVIERIGAATVTREELFERCLNLKRATHPVGT